MISCLKETTKFFNKAVRILKKNAQSFQKNVQVF